MMESAWANPGFASLFSKAAKSVTSTGFSIYNGLLGGGTATASAGPATIDGNTHDSLIKKFMGEDYHRRHSEMVAGRTSTAFTEVGAGHPSMIDRLHIRKFFKL